MVSSSTFPSRMSLTSADSGGALGQMPLARVVERCCEQNAFYSQGAQSDPQFCLELFRRAFLEGDQGAWEAVYRQYAPLVRRWVQHHSAFPATGEDVEYFVNGAFARTWRAFVNDREKFARIRDLASLLRYLKLSVHSEISDRLRKVQNEAPVPDEVADQPERPDGDGELEQTQLWQFIQNRLNGAQEQTAVYERFVLELKPNTIYAQHQDLFTSVREVYSVLQNVLRRLRRSDELLKYLAGSGSPVRGTHHSGAKPPAEPLGVLSWQPINVVYARSQAGETLDSPVAACLPVLQ